MSRAARSPFVWTDEPPRRASPDGDLWWHRYNRDSSPSIVKVFRGEGESELSVQWGDLDDDPDALDASVCWVENWTGDGHQWAGPVQEPCNPPFHDPTHP